MTERYIYVVKRQRYGHEKLEQVATRDPFGEMSGEPLPEPVQQRLEACARGKQEKHEFLWCENPQLQAAASNRDRWLFERQLQVVKEEKKPAASKSTDPEAK